METLTLAVRCTREEYLQFYATNQKAPAWVTVIGAVVLVITAVIAAIEQTLTQHTLLLGLIGMITVMLSPFILPTVRKGAAGRRYDASDSLKGAVTLIMTPQTLTVRSACQEGTVPLSALTAVLQTNAMTALVFGKELTVCIPMRTMNEEETVAFHAMLSAYKKEQTQ